MMYATTFSFVLASCLAGFFGKHVEQHTFLSTAKSGHTLSDVSNISDYLVGNPICEKSVVFGQHTSPVDVSSFMDRLKCRVTGSVVRHESGKDGQESFYQCSHVKNCHDQNNIPVDVQKAAHAKTEEFIKLFEQYGKANVQEKTNHFESIG